MTNQKAIWALVVGILSVFCCSPAGIIAIVLGRGATREITASNGAQSGGGMAKVGVILGIVGLVLMVLGVLVYVGTGANPFDFVSNTSR